MEEPADSQTPNPSAEPPGAGEKHRLFGEIAVEKGLATEEQINEGLKVQEDLRRMEMPEKIGQILIKRKILTRPQVLAILRDQGVKPIQEIIEGFEILEKIGQGGMGAVFRAVQLCTGKEVALKILPPRYNKDHTYLQRFLREARVAAQLNHPNIVQCIDAGVSRGHHFIAMEFVGGEDLETVLRRRGKFKENEALDIAEQVGRALDHAHRKQLVHRDIKPSNIMIAGDGLTKLLDLGLAKGIGPGNASDTNRITQTGVAVGTPSYISPEQAQGLRDVDTRADIYSLGATLFHFLTGEPPFSAPSPAGVLVQHISSPVPLADEIEPTVSRATTRLIEIMMAKSPEGRFATPQDLIAAIRGALDGKIPRAPERSGSLLDGPTLVPAGSTSTLMKIGTSVKSGVGKTADVMGKEVKGWFHSRFFLAAAGAGIVMLAAAIVLDLAGFGRETGANDGPGSGPHSQDWGETLGMKKKPEPTAGPAEKTESDSEVETPDPKPTDPEEDVSADDLVDLARDLKDSSWELLPRLVEALGNRAGIPPELREDGRDLIQRIDRMERRLAELEESLEAQEEEEK